MTMTKAPERIERDTYQGRHTMHVPLAKVKSGAFRASEIASLASEGVLWESFGSTFPGRESFGRNRYRANLDGSLNVYDGDGRLIIVHPADRILRLRTA